MTEFKIYTKLGDKGETSLIGGLRVPKYHERIEAYGTLDELNSFIGLIRDQKINKHYKKILTEIQSVVFILESILATDPQSKTAKELPVLSEKDVELLEKEIDEMNEELPPLRNFILPGGHSTVSYCHIARTVCRRSERLVIKMSGNNIIDPLVLQYLNRLSDYFFVLARKLGKDLDADEIPWISNA